MAFFDNLSRKASEATAKAVQKAQDMSEAARFNSMISEEEDKIEKTYYQLGKLYVSVHRSDSEDVFSEMVATVIDAEEKISTYRRQIQDIKGMQRCTRCGTGVPKGNAFCSSCGAPMPKVEVSAPEESVKCEGCGAVIKVGMRFCTSCGKPVARNTTLIDAAQSVADDPPFEQPDTGLNDKSKQVAPETIQQPTDGQRLQGRVCPNCGANLDDGQSFCIECGTRM